MGLTGRYSQAAQLQPAAKQLFILTFAFKPNGIKIHQVAITDVIKWRVTLSQPSSLKQCILQIMRRPVVNTNFTDFIAFAI